jgi:hypothetical protein
LCFVADGQGGRADGAAAARAACDGALEAARNRKWEDFASGATWDEVFAAADQAVQRSCDGFTTLIGFAIDPDSMTGASVGDSKVFVHDSTGAFKELTERQQKNPPVGGGCHRAYTFCLPKLSGTVLAVTDGVWKYSGYEALRDVASTGNVEQISEILRETVVSRQGTDLPDDFTVLAATNSEQVAADQLPARGELKFQ